MQDRLARPVERPTALRGSPDNAGGGSRGHERSPCGSERVYPPPQRRHAPVDRRRCRRDVAPAPFRRTARRDRRPGSPGDPRDRVARDLYDGLLGSGGRSGADFHQKRGSAPLPLVRQGGVGPGPAARRGSPAGHRSCIPHARRAAVGSARQPDPDRRSGFPRRRADRRRTRPLRGRAQRLPSGDAFRRRI